MKSPISCNLQQSMEFGLFLLVQILASTNSSHCFEYFCSNFGSYSWSLFSWGPYWSDPIQRLSLATPKILLTLKNHKQGLIFGGGLGLMILRATFHSFNFWTIKRLIKESVSNKRNSQSWSVYSLTCFVKGVLVSIATNKICAYFNPDFAWSQRKCN